jgi:hypothetical protein
MDPLRCGAGEAGAFHQFGVPRKQYEQISIAASVSCLKGRLQRRNSPSESRVSAGPKTCGTLRQSSRARGVEVALWPS